MRCSDMADVMSRNKFETLLRHLHFVNNLGVTDETKKSTKLWKLKPWLSSLRENFLKVSPEGFQSVDEIMVPFKGKSSLRQYMPAKPHKWGFKLWGRSGVSGFLYDFSVYEGKAQGHEISECGGSGDIVLKLTKTLPRNAGFKIFAVNYFTRVFLAAKLLKDGFFYVGTIRVPRMRGCQLESEKKHEEERTGIN